VFEGHFEQSVYARLYHGSGELLPSQLHCLPVILVTDVSACSGWHVGQGVEGAALFFQRDEAVEQAEQRLRRPGAYTGPPVSST
jgi:hypothetical protein